MNLENVITLRKRLIIAMLVSDEIRRDFGNYYVRNNKPIGGPRGMRPRTLAKKVLAQELRANGYSYPEIGNQLGISHQAAHYLLNGRTAKGL
jgi:hypothetical protein